MYLGLLQEKGYKVISTRRMLRMLQRLSSMRRQAGAMDFSMLFSRGGSETSSSHMLGTLSMCSMVGSVDGSH
tara:strand:+ start:1773 stop:1988 length:216 start_codon:yes stop_codon:yes gene_type:complete